MAWLLEGDEFGPQNNPQGEYNLGDIEKWIDESDRNPSWDGD